MGSCILFKSCFCHLCEVNCSLERYQSTKKSTHTLKTGLERLLFPQNWLWSLRLSCEAGGSLREVHDSTCGAEFRVGWGQLKSSHSAARTIKVGPRQDSGFMNLENGGEKGFNVHSYPKSFVFVHTPKIGNHPVKIPLNSHFFPPREPSFVRLFSDPTSGLVFVGVIV